MGCNGSGSSCTPAMSVGSKGPFACSCWAVCTLIIASLPLFLAFAGCSEHRRMFRPLPFGIPLLPTIYTCFLPQFHRYWVSAWSRHGPVSPGIHRRIGDGPCYQRVSMGRTSHQKSVRLSIALWYYVQLHSQSEWRCDQRLRKRTPRRNAETGRGSAEDRRRPGDPRQANWCEQTRRSRKRHFSTQGAGDFWNMGRQDKPGTEGAMSVPGQHLRADCN